MPYQQAVVPQPHLTANQATVGSQVVFQAQSAYDYEITNAELAGLVQGTKYTITEVFTSIGDPMIAVNGIHGNSFDMQMFTLFVALFGFTSAAVTAAGTGGTADGTYVLPLPAAPTGGTNAVGHFTVTGGVIASVVINTQGSGYANQNVVINNAALVTAGAVGLTGGSITVTAAQLN